MSYKMGLLLSVVFLMSVFLFGADLLILNATYQTLDAIAMYVGNRVSYDGWLSPATKEYVVKQGATLTLESSSTPAVGETFTFAVQKTYTPIIMKKSPFNVRVVRSCIVGFYRPIS